MDLHVTDGALTLTEWSQNKILEEQEWSKPLLIET